MVIATSLIGSYLVIRSVSLLLGGYPSETVINDFIRYHESYQLETFVFPKINTYLVCWAFLSVQAIVFQLWLNKEEKKSNDKSDYVKQTDFDES